MIIEKTTLKILRITHISKEFDELIISKRGPDYFDIIEKSDFYTYRISDNFKGILEKYGETVADALEYLIK